MMKIFVACIFASLFSVSATAQLDAEEAALERAIDSYGKVYGAWLVDKQCSFLTADAAAKFQNDLHIIQEAIPPDPAIQNMHLLVEDSAKEVASTPPFSECGQESEALVTQAITLANDWASRIRSLRPQSAG
jgi:hypothetical protein